MDIVKMEKKKNRLIKAKDNLLYEKKQLMQEYEKLKDIVIRSGLATLICVLFQAIVVKSLIGSGKIVSMGLGRYLTPFVLGICLVSAIVFVLKGFDLFVNSDIQWSKKVADKLEKERYTDKITELNSAIVRLDIEIEKVEKELYGNDDYNEEKLDKKAESKRIEKVKINKNIEDKGIKDTNIEDINIGELKANINEVDKKRSEESVDDILNALNSWDIDDDDDEFENTSEMWKKDSKGLG